MTFFPASVFFTGFSFSTAVLSTKVVLSSPLFSVLLAKVITLAEVLKQKQVLTFLKVTSAYDNFSNSAIKGINSLQKVKLWTNA